MINLKPVDLANLKLLLAGKTLAIKAQIDTLNILRSEMPDLFSGLTKEQLTDNKFLVKYLSDPYNRNKLRDALRNDKSLTASQVIELEESLEEKPTVTGGEIYQQGQEEGQAGQEAPPPTGSSGGGMPMPSAPSFSTPGRRIIHNVPQTKPDITIAHSSGAPVEQVKEFHITDRSGNITATYSREPAPAAAQPKLVTANSSGIVKEGAGDASKLVSARSDGSVIQSTAAKPTIHIADKSGNVVKTYNIKSPGALRNFGSNLGSKINIGLNKGINKAISGINNFSLGGSGGRGRNIMGRLSRFGKGGSSLGRAGSMGGRSGSLIGKAKGRGGLIFAISLIGFMLLVGGLTAFAPPSTPGTAAPITGPAPTSPVRGLDYTLPLKDPSIQPLDIRTQVKAAFPGAKLEYWDKIIQSSIAAGFNPALALALWIEETEASQATLAKNGGSEIATGGTFSKGHFGCAPWEDQTIDESLSCLIKFSANYTNDQFPEFMAAYSGGPAGTPFSNNPNFPANVKNWYSQLVPSGNGALTPITPVLPGTPSGPSGFVFYCQGNTQWQSICSLGSSGCGPSSLAMVLTTFQASCNGNVCTPLEVDKVFTTNVWRSCGGPSSMYVALQSDWLKNLGFEVGPNLGSGATLDSSEAKKYLDQGYYIIGSSGQYPCANCKISGALIDHIFVIDAIDIQANTVDIRDPNNCSYTDGDDENQSNRTKSISAFPWLYAYPIKKVR